MVSSPPCKYLGSWKGLGKVLSGSKQIDSSSERGVSNCLFRQVLTSVDCSVISNRQFERRGV